MDEFLQILEQLDRTAFALYILAVLAAGAVLNYYGLFFHQVVIWLGGAVLGLLGGILIGELVDSDYVWLWGVGGMAIIGSLALLLYYAVVFGVGVLLGVLAAYSLTQEVILLGLAGVVGGFVMVWIYNFAILALTALKGSFLLTYGLVKLYVKLSSSDYLDLLYRNYESQGVEGVLPLLFMPGCLFVAFLASGVVWQLGFRFRSGKFSRVHISKLAGRDGSTPPVAEHLGQEPAPPAPVQPAGHLGQEPLPPAPIQPAPEQLPEPVQPDRAYVIGRSAECDICLDDPSVSRIHAQVQMLADGRVSIVDSNSTNGTFFFDGHQWREFTRATVNPTVRIRFGGCEMLASELNGKRF